MAMHTHERATIDAIMIGKEICSYVNKTSSFVSIDSFSGYVDRKSPGLFSYTNEKKSS